MDKSLQSFIKAFKESEASTSVLFGLIVVIVAGTLLFNYFRTDNQAQVTDEAAATEANFVSPAGVNLPTNYTVEAGDHLWKIAEKHYGSGYNWVDIAKANNLDNPGMIIAGTSLNIPQVEAKLATVILTSASTANNEITGSSYEVVEGDTLWDIAVRAYGDGYSWTKIYEANKTIVANPGMIEVGMQFSIPR